MAGRDKRKADADASKSAAKAGKKANTAAGAKGAAASKSKAHHDSLSATERAYLAWMKSAGVRLTGVSIDVFPGTGRGCLAVTDLKQGDVVVEVPESAILTAETCCAKDALRQFFDGELDSAPRLDREALVLAVMCEIARGNESNLAPYLNQLPNLRATHSPLAWRADELYELKGTTCLHRTFDQEDESAELPSMTHEHWRLVAKPFFEEYPQYKVSDDELFLKKTYLHATALVAGFSFTLGEEDDVEDEEAFEGCVPVNDENDGDEHSDHSHDHEQPHQSTQAMVPFWDMLNHVEPNRACVRLEYDEHAQVLKMVMVRDVKNGEQVFNTYGALGDDELLRRYGFVSPHNPHGGNAEVSLREVVAAAATARFVVEDSYEDDEVDGRDTDESGEDEDFEEPKMPSTSDSEEESHGEDDEGDADDEDELDSEEDDTFATEKRGFGSLTLKETLARLRLLKRWGVASASEDRFTISRTGKPSLALRAAARVMSMHTYQFQQLLAADAYERGDRLEQHGDDGDDDGDDVFGVKPLSTERVWDGKNDETSDEGTSVHLHRESWSI
jgi:N-lysine methyltransferase SETD6